MTVDLSRLDVPRQVVEAEAKHLRAVRHTEERLARAAWLVAHPDWPTGAATATERLELRHLLDPALDYTRRQETK